MNENKVFIGGVNINEVKLVPNLFLVGLPGIGKTVRIRELAIEEAKRLGKKFIDLRAEKMTPELFNQLASEPDKYFIYYRIIAPHVAPEDLNFPIKATTKYDGTTEMFVKFVPPLILKALCIDGIHGVLFIDELTNVRRSDVKSLFFSLVQEGEFGWDSRLSDNIKIVMAGNPPEVSSVASLLPTPMLRRLTVIYVSQSTVDEWAKWMEKTYGERWDRRVLAYLYAFENDFCNIPSTIEGLENYPAPHNWTVVATEILPRSREYSRDYFRELLKGRLGPEVGAKFYKFLSKRVPTLKKIFDEPEVFNGLDLEVKYMFLMSMASKPDQWLYKKTGRSKQPMVRTPAKRFISYLADEYQEMLVMLLKFLASPEDRRIFVSKLFSAECARVIDKIMDYMGD